MDNLTMLSQTIHFQRTAWQNSMAIISAVQEHGEKLLKTTLQQSPWIPGNSKKACLYWADIWTKNLAGMTDLVDQNLAEIERLSSAGDQSLKKEQPQKKAAATKSKEPAQSAATVKKPISKKKPVAVKPQAAKMQMPPTKPAVELSPKPAVEHVAAVKATAPTPAVPEPPPAKQPAVVKKPIDLKT